VGDAWFVRALVARSRITHMALRML